MCCKETYNPAGKNIPPAGSTTLPGSKGGINEDGFYELCLVLPDSIQVPANLKIRVVDCGSGTEFGPFEAGTRVKYTEANGATPTIKSMTGENSKADAVDYQIKGNGDMRLKAVLVDENDNVLKVVAECNCCCPVPPPPK